MQSRDLVELNKVAFVFPGQGSQTVGMGQDFFDAFQSVRDIYAQANDILGFDLARLSFEGPEEKLRQTELTQPALFVHSVAISLLLKSQNVEADMMAGHSLGEYSALTATGAISFEQGLRLVKLRGRLMQNAGKLQSGTMVAIIGLDFDHVGKICLEASGAGTVSPANFNSPGQVVISGSIDGVKEAMRLATEMGAKKIIELNVSGAFHSLLMQPAREIFGQALKEVNFSTPEVPVFFNVTAKPSNDVKRIGMLLEEQLTSPVLWSNSIENMIAAGANQFLEVGSGNVLTGLIRRINRDVATKTVGTLSQLETVLQ